MHYVVADEGKIRQIPINLLGNAIKFTDTASSDARWFEAKERAGALWLSAGVEDTGAGLTARGTEKLFEPIYPNKAAAFISRRMAGLAISRKYARLMGGDITVSRTPGAGIDFSR